MSSRTPKRNKLLFDSINGLAVTPPNRILTPRSFNTAVAVVTGDTRIDKGPAVVNGLSPSSLAAAEAHQQQNSVLSPSETRRGRPRAETLNSLILEGSTSPSSIKCTFCGRVFPREKSLQAHLRTHTGEKPYGCDYPRCPRRFAQSGQLKTHQRLHTGEKPFICSSGNCENRFTHANRHCPEHPDLQLKRFTTITTTGCNIEKKFDEAHNAEVREWLQNKDSRSSSKRVPSLGRCGGGGYVAVENCLETTPKKSKYDKNNKVLFSSNSAVASYCFSSCSQTSLNNDNNRFLRSGDGDMSPTTTTTTTTTMTSSSASELDDNSLSEENEIIIGDETTMQCGDSGGVGDENSSLHHHHHRIELPKKRWLREAVQEQQLWQLDDLSNEHDEQLAQPINWGDVVVGATTTVVEEQTLSSIDYITVTAAPLVSSNSNYNSKRFNDDNDDDEPPQVIVQENQKRPSVLVRIQDGKSKQITSDDMQGAIALVELKNGQKQCVNFKYRI